MRESGELINDAQRVIARGLRKLLTTSEDTITEQMVKATITESLKPFLYEKTERHPMVLPVIMPV